WWAGKRRNWIFSPQPCAASRNRARPAAAIPATSLRPDRGGCARHIRRHSKCGMVMSSLRSQSRRLLPRLAGAPAPGGGSGYPRCGAEGSVAAPLLWVPPRDEDGAARWRHGWGASGAADSENGQLTGRAQTEVCSYYGFRASLHGLPESGAICACERYQSAMGGGYHLHTAGARVRISGGGAGCLFAPCGGLVAG